MWGLSEEDQEGQCGYRGVMGEEGCVLYKIREVLGTDCVGI